MAKAGELKWDEELNKTDEYKHTPTALWSAVPGCGVDPLNKAELRNKPGEVPRKPSDEEIAKAILHNAPKQPTDEEMFGHLVVSEEQMKKAQEDWENGINNFYEEAKKSVDDKEYAWATGKSFNDSLTEEEKTERNMFTEK